MLTITFLIAVIALVIAVLAYQKAEGSKDLKEQLAALREKTADTLGKMEKALRKENKEGGDSAQNESSE